MIERYQDALLVRLVYRWRELDGKAARQRKNNQLCRKNSPNYSTPTLEFPFQRDSVRISLIPHYKRQPPFFLSHQDAASSPLIHSTYLFQFLKIEGFH
ncbi:hypothetical protein THIOM_001420 [Candidatus Thiomargarita nelsonii]|uniref:Uncharacterized protein n=1 Tax=Candidatus Thiomargarita nelsonii TaxID=1003181 RepID=A0A176S4A7_9GAMM|nr:hypothetical protein THIOM_001420 [Candidatus Thiomargarita nelsonii]